MNLLDTTTSSRKSHSASRPSKGDQNENSLNVDIGLDLIVTSPRSSSKVSDSSYKSSLDSQTEILSVKDIGPEVAQDHFIEVLSKRQLRKSTVRARAGGPSKL